VRLWVALIASISLSPAALAQQRGDAAAEPALLGDPARGAVWRWIEGWGSQDGKDLGSTHGCMVVDRQGRILVNTDTEDAVIVFSKDGRVVERFGRQFRGGLHGMTLRVEGDEEVLYLAHTGRHELVKMTRAGKVLWTLGFPEQAGIYEQADQYRPTAVAVAADGRLFAADGYGKSWVHIYDKDQGYLKSFGGPGKADGKMRTPHGLWLDARGEEPLLLVCDRENHRLQWFTLQGEFVRKVTAGMRRPCNVYPLRGKGRTGWLAVADLTGRVAILDEEDEVVVLLGDNAPDNLRATNRVGREQWRPGRFFAPHSVCADAEGSLYVMDWSAIGRVSKLAWALNE